MTASRNLLAVCLGVAVVGAAASCGDSSSATTAPLADAGADSPDRIETDSAVPPDAACACTGAELCVDMKCKLVVGFAVRKVFLGETDRTGAPSNVAWKAYGRNIDALASTGAAPTTECMRVAGASAQSQDDGNDGIDNSWGRNVIPFFTGLIPDPSKSTNALLEAGGRTPMLEFGDPPKQTAPVLSVGLVTAEDSFALKWDGTDQRPVAESSVSNGKAKTVFAAASINAGVVTSGDATAPYVLNLSFGLATLDIPIRLVRVSMTLSADGKTAKDGILSGVVKTSELEAAFDKVRGSISTQLCSGSTLDSVKSVLRQASDILSDGTQDPTKTCDAISIGVGFEASLVALGSVAGPVAPGKDPCP